MRHSVTGDVRSGPVSELSVGSVTSGRPVSGSGTMSDASLGAVKKDADSPLREEISQPLHDLRGLQEQMRNIEPLSADQLDTTAVPPQAGDEAASADEEANAPEEESGYVRPCRDIRAAPAFGCSEAFIRAAGPRRGCSPSGGSAAASAASVGVQ